MAQIVAATPAGIAQAAARLRAGELVAMPTETVYGLAGNADDPQAVAKIFSTKGRPADHPLIVHVLGADDLPRWAERIPAAAKALAHAFWPGPLTMILPRAAGVHDLVTGGQASVGLRCPSHPVARALLQAFGGAVAAPSANKFGRISPTRAAHVAADYPDQDLLVLDGGEAEVGVESTIVDLSRIDEAGAVLLRPGAITPAQIEAVIGLPVRAPDAAAPRASGTLASHYAPRKPLTLVDAAQIAQCDGPTAARTAVLAFAPGAQAWAWQQTAPRDAHAYAHGLYAWLRAMDASDATQLWVERIPDDDAWAAVRDRLSRAAYSLRAD